MKWIVIEVKVKVKVKVFHYKPDVALGGSRRLNFLDRLDIRHD